MAAQAGHDISRMKYDTSRNSASSSGKSFSSWGNRKRPRDSLESTRERAREMRPTRLKNYSIQQVRRGQGLIVEEEEKESEESSLSQSTVSCSLMGERYPKGKALALVFVLNMIVSYAYRVAIMGILNLFDTEKDQILNSREKNAYMFVHLLFQFCIGCLFYPVAGFIADVYTGRCRMIKISLVLLALGYIILIVAFIIGGQSNLTGNVAQNSIIWLYVIRTVALIFVSAGGGCFEATIIPFGVDQLQGASSAEISSYFYFFYFSRNLGLILGITIYNLVLYGSMKINSNEFNNYLMLISKNPQINDLYGVFQPLVTLVILTVGLVLIICLHHWFFKNTLWENPVKLIARVLCYAATVRRHLLVRNRAFRYGEEKKRRIELAKITYDGKFPDEKVEDVKAFCSIFLLLSSLIPTMFSISSVSSGPYHY